MLFVCLVAHIVDADTLRCSSGEVIRVAAINAREHDGTCRRGAPCPAMRDRHARRIAASLALGKPLRCRRLGVSYGRTVAECALPDGRSLGCALVEARAAAWWPSYAARYRLSPCPAPAARSR